MLNLYARIWTSALFAFLALVLLGAGYWYYRAESDEITRSKFQSLVAVSELTARQIQQWRKEHIEEARRMASDSLLVEALEKYLVVPGDETLRSRLAVRMKSEVTDPDHAETLLVNSASNLLAANDEDGGLVTVSTRKAVNEALATNQTVFSELFRAPDGAVHIDIAAPVSDAGGHRLGVLILRHQAATFLYPLIQFWPFPSHSAETIMVQREGEEVVFLNDLRDRNNTALSRRFPLTETTVPSVQVVRGKRGIFEGTDYRGIKVVSALAPIPGSPWFIVSKVDSEEILAEARVRATLISVIVGLLLLLTAALIIAFYRLRQEKILVRLLDSERKTAAAREDVLTFEGRHRDILKTAMNGYSLVDMPGRLREVSENFCSMLGYSEQELLTMGICDLDVELSPETATGKLRLISTRGQGRFETRYRRKDGRIIDVEVSVQHRPSENLFVAFHNEITESKRTSAALREAEKIASEKTALLESILESPQSVVIFALDTSYRYLEFTKTHKETIKNIWGVEIETGMNMLDVIRDPVQREVAKGNFDRVLGGEWFMLVEKYGDVLHRSHYENRYSPIVDASGNVTGLTVFVIDISERILAEEAIKSSDARFREVIQSSPVAMAGLDARQNVTFLNPEFVGLFGYSHDDLPSASSWWLMAYPDPEYRKWAMDGWLGALDRAKQTGLPVSPLEVVARCKNGTDKNVIINSAPLSTSSDEGYVLSFMDITKEHERQRLLEVATAEAISANRAKSEFLAVMSHELRTPLNGVLGFAEVLSATALDGEQQEFVQTIRDSGEHLLGVVNDILDFSSIEKISLKLESAPVLISSLLKDAGAAIRKAAADKGLEFRCETAPGVPDQIQGDGRRIRQILINLLGNAVKFTALGSVVFRVAPAADGEQRFLDFIVEDTGPGIPPEMLGRLFLPFVQADSSLQRPFEGSGLGLAISQRLAEAMGGVITVKSAPAKGSVFTFRLPVEMVIPSAPAPLASPSMPVALLANGLVLVVEDERINRMLVGNILKSIGMRVETADNGQIAVGKFSPGKYCAILMDMQMPVMNGLEATARIREIEVGTGTHAPIIALTANVMNGDRERCHAAGMDDFLTKPFKKAELAASLSRFAVESSHRPRAGSDDASTAASNSSVNSR